MRLIQCPDIIKNKCIKDNRNFEDSCTCTSHGGYKELHRILCVHCPHEIRSEFNTIFNNLETIDISKLEQIIIAGML
jgi:hypothetical protein